MLARVLGSYLSSRPQTHEEAVFMHVPNSISPVSYASYLISPLYRNVLGCSEVLFPEDSLLPNSDAQVLCPQRLEVISKWFTAILLFYTNTSRLLQQTEILAHQQSKCWWSCVLCIQVPLTQTVFFYITSLYLLIISWLQIQAFLLGKFGDMNTVLFSLLTLKCVLKQQIFSHKLSPWN